MHLLRIIIVLITGTLACSAAEALQKIAFGSCAKQQLEQPIWETIVAANPDLFIFCGDNIYGDSHDMTEMKARWDAFGAKPGYQKLKATCPILATWDDHDYGWNDAGAEYPEKAQTQQLFLDFFAEPKDSPRRKQEGIYDAKIIGPEGKRVQITLLDTRYHRSPLIKRKKLDFEPGEGINGIFLPNNDPETTILGATQWEWLKQQLLKPAEIRILVSSIQVISNEHWYEKWGNFPHERARLFRLIRETKADNLVILSGDRHTSEISRIDNKTVRPLHDITASALNQRHLWRSELNPHRLGGMYFDPNFGMLVIDWSTPSPTVRMQIQDLKGKVVLQATQSMP